MIDITKVKPLDTIFWVIWEDPFCEPEWLPAIYLGENEGGHYVRAFNSYVVGEDPYLVEEEIKVCTRKVDFKGWLEKECRLDYPLNLEEYIFSHSSTKKPFDLERCFHTEREAMRYCFLLRGDRLIKHQEFSRGWVGRYFREEGDKDVSEKDL